MNADLQLNNIIEELKSLDLDYPWCEQFDPPEIYVICSKGLIEGFSAYVYPIDGPFVISEQDYKAFCEQGSDHEAVDSDLDTEEALEMIKAGCKPSVEYYKWSSDMLEDEDYHQWQEIFDAFTDMMTEYGEAIPWEDLNDDELIMWYEILRHAKNGHTSWEKVPESEKN